MSYSRHKLKKINELADKAIAQHSAFYAPAIKAYLNVIKELEEELVDLEDNENLFLAYQNLSTLLKNFLNQYDNINFELINESIKTIKNVFNHKENYAAKYRSAIQENLLQTAKILEDYCTNLSSSNAKDTNELNHYLPIIQLLKNASLETTSTPKLHKKRRAESFNAGLTERKAMKLAKQKSMQDFDVNDSSEALNILASVALEETQKAAPTPADLSSTQEPAPLTPDNSIPTNQQRNEDLHSLNSDMTKQSKVPTDNSPSTSSFAFFNPASIPRYTNTPGSFDAWYKQLQEQQTVLFPSIKPYLPEPNHFLFSMFKEEYRKQYGHETPEKEEIVLKNTSSKTPYLK